MKMRNITMILTLLIVIMAFGITARGESYSASTMRLLKYNGDVVIEDAEGNPRFVMENVRFASGEAMKTGKGASASVNLDSTKIVTLDEQSRVEFALNGNHMELNLTEGVLFLDVSEKLDPERFVMCNRSFIVNLRHVSNVTAEYLLIGDTRISVSKSHRKELMKRFSSFLGDSL